MMDLNDIRDMVSSLFIMLNKNSFILFRIEFLVVFVTSLFLAMFIMDIFRRCFHSSIMKAIFSLFDAVSDSIVVYLLGAMQTAPFKNQLFPVWALVLVVFRHNIDFISGYGVPDNNGGRRSSEWRNVIKLLGAAFLIWTRGSQCSRQLWTLWSLQIMRSWYRLWSHTMASQSVWHGKSSELVSEHMRSYHESNKWKHRDDCNPNTIEGYKYLVYGERFMIKKPQYVIEISSAQEGISSPRTTRESSLITLDKIWTCRGNLLENSSQRKDLATFCHPFSLSRFLRCKLHDPKNMKDETQWNEQKDLCLAFALSRLLRCRLEDLVLPKDLLCLTNRKLVKNKIMEGGAKRAFRVMELQLAYVDDCFNSRYPSVFWSGLSSLNMSLFLSVMTSGVVLWLSVDIHRIYKPQDDELARLVQGINVDMIITWVFLFFVMLKEILEMATYILSDWTRLLLVCMYVKWYGKRFVNSFMEKTILSLFASNIAAKRWHGLLDQYVFVQSYDGRPKVWNWFHTVTTGMVPKKEDGAKLGSAIPVPDCVRSNIVKKLIDILKPINSDDSSLSEDIKILSSDNRKERYDWAFQLQTSSQVILVWHIATSFCEMELAKKHSVDLSNPGFMRSIFLCLTNCCSSKPNLLNEDEKDKEKNINSGFMCSLLSSFKSCFSSKSVKEKLPGELKESYIIANSLSRYCTYLLVSKPDLIPDSFLVPQMVFQKAVKSARDVILRSCDSLETRYNKLCLEAYKAAENRDDVVRGDDVVKQGAMLGKDLLREEEKDRWDILAGVWTELIIHIAPTWNAEAHKKCIESGKEFITIIWALLWHCGIVKSNLWPADDASENNAPTDVQASDARNNDTSNAGTDTDDQQTSVQDEIMEISHDVTTEDQTVVTGMGK